MEENHVIETGQRTESTPTNEVKREKVRVIPIQYVDDFPNHPFQVREDEEMKRLVESVKEYGVLTPVVARKTAENRFELISGHRRKRACELAGIKVIPLILRDMTREEAIIAMVDSNLQREHILPSEKAFAYKMKLEAMKRQGQRVDLTSTPLVSKLKRSNEEVGDQSGESRDVLKGSEELLFAMLPLPSETRFGMASLLPHQAISYFNKVVSIDGKPTNSIAARNAILSEKNKGYAAISYDDINGMSRNDLRTYMADKSLVYIYHNMIDNAGEHSESRVFDVVESAVDEILMLIRKLYNSLQISNFYVTADHGFLYRRNEVLESGKYSDIMALKAPEASKRFVLSDDPDMRIQYASEFNLDDVSGGDYKVIVPYSYGIFKTNGGGIQYVHGGASLQETIVPIIHISELSAAKNKDAVTPVGVRLKTITRKITNRSFTLEFEQFEKVGELKQAITCETYLVDEDGNKVSGEYKFVAGSESDDPESRSIKIRFALMNIEFDRNKRYYLILKNVANPDEYIEKEQFTIDILQFKMF